MFCSLTASLSHPQNRSHSDQVAGAHSDSHVRRVQLTYSANTWCQIFYTEGSENVVAANVCPSEDHAERLLCPWAQGFRNISLPPTAAHEIARTKTHMTFTQRIRAKAGSLCLNNFFHLSQQAPRRQQLMSFDTIISPPSGAR